VEAPRNAWLVKDKRGLLLAMVEHLGGNAHISFEGELKKLPMWKMAGISKEPTPILRRNTLWPEQDFVVMPLEPLMSKTVILAIGGTLSGTILHVQIEKDGVLQFGAYDRFYPQCLFFGNAVSTSLIESLVARGVMRPYIEKRRRLTRDGKAPEPPAPPKPD
jgi:hypothetical protein